MDVSTVRWLGTAAGREALAALPGPEDSGVFALSTRLRSAGYSAEHVAALLTQRELRARAATKFGEFAADLLFTRDGLEQATRLELAATHAQRFAAASLATVHDLGCGIGIDAVTLSVLGVTVHAIDADPVTAAVADINLRPWPDSRARVGLAEDFVPSADPGRDRTGVWSDPARRVPGVADHAGRTRRVVRLEEMSPSWSTVCAIAASVPATGAKLAPGFPHERLPAGSEAQWTSWNGDVLECAIWWGPLVRVPGRTARVMSTSARPAEVDESMADPRVPHASSLADVGAWLYEPDRAVVRAGLTGAVTGPTGGLEVEAGLGYVLGSRAIDLPFARRFEVREAMPFTVKGLRSWLRERGVTGATIKKRGVRLDEERLRRDLRIGRGAGDGEQATVVLTRIAGRAVALVLGSS